MRGLPTLDYFWTGDAFIAPAPMYGESTGKVQVPPPRHNMVLH
jgi:hypothetical protein